jgi:hypothetical protein
MRDYRAYILGVDGHRFVWVADFRADYADDAAALDAAKQLSDKHDIEVWDGGRLVALLSQSGEKPPGSIPTLVPAPISDGELNPVNQAESDSVSRVLELVTLILESKPSFDFLTDSTAAD